MLPCERCRINYGRHLRKFPITPDVLKTKDAFFAWWVGIHNEARGYEVSVGETANYYYRVYTGDATYKKVIVVIILLLVMVCVIKKYYVG